MMEKTVYVDKYELLELLEKKIKADNERRMAVVDSDFIDLVNDATEINDVAPVVHGEWVYVHTYLRGRCSICQSSMQYDNQPYCAHCGAKMDGGNRNADA